MWNHHDLNIRDHSSAAWLHVRPPRDRGRLSRDGSLHLNVCRWWQTSFLPLVSSTSAQLSRCFLPCLISSLSHISGHSHSLPLAFLPFPLLGLLTVCSPPPPPPLPPLFISSSCFLVSFHQQHWFCLGKWAWLPAHCCLSASSCTLLTTVEQVAACRNSQLLKWI